MCFGRGLVSVVAVLALYGCAGREDAAGPGQDCYRDDDCKDGFVCVANAQGNRVCSKDVTSLASTVEAPPPPPDAGTSPDDAGAP
ncbi:MAG TPA: hypothetical protein VLJ38_09820 [Polyangiaceae bacterium]|nr:hypothetical protein [Polyangiaceae bacterium]